MKGMYEDMSGSSRTSSVSSQSEKKPLVVMAPGDLNYNQVHPVPNYSRLASTPAQPSGTEPTTAKLLQLLQLLNLHQMEIQIMTF